MLNKNNETGDAPKAYLNYLVFDRNYKLLDGSFIRVSEAAKENGSDGAHEELFKEIVIKEAGYVYFYVSNDNVALGGSAVEVYFDDFKVEHVKSPVVQVDDYYPFGLTFNSYSRENTVPNNLLFQEKEWQDELGLNVYDFDWRQYDPAIGRTTTQDPHSFYYWDISPYSFLGNNPINTLDPTGMDTTKVHDLDMRTFKPEEDVVLLDEVVVTPDTNPDTSDTSEAESNQDNDDGAEASIAIPLVLLEAPVVTIAAPSAALLTAIFVLIPNPTNNGEMEALQRMRLEAKKKELEKERERIKSKDELEKAQEQLEGIEEAQGRAKKNAKGKGKQNKINSVKKSEQRLDHQLDRVDNLDDLQDF